MLVEFHQCGPRLIAVGGDIDRLPKNLNQVEAVGVVVGDLKMPAVLPVEGVKQDSKLVKEDGWIAFVQIEVECAEVRPLTSHHPDDFPVLKMLIHRPALQLALGRDPSIVGEPEVGRIAAPPSEVFPKDVLGDGAA